MQEYLDHDKQQQTEKATDDGGEFVMRWWQQNETSVLSILRSIVRPIATSLGLGVDETARELLVTVASVVFSKDGFDPSRGSMQSWIIGIAQNKVKAWRTKAFKENSRRVSQPLLVSGDDASPDIWEQLQSAKHTERDVTGDSWVEQTLRYCSPSDAQLIRDVVLDEVSSEEAALSWTVNTGKPISAATARVRLHRALSRLAVAIPPDEREPIHKATTVTNCQGGTR